MADPAGNTAEAALGLTLDITGAAVALMGTRSAAGKGSLATAAEDIPVALV